MVSLLALWMPIVVAAVLVFLVSSVLHMALKYHRADYKALPREAAILDAMRGADLVPGYYFFPFCSDMKEMSSPEMLAKQKRGPVGMLTVRPSGPHNMATHLGLWFAFALLVSVFAAYIAGRTLVVGAPYLPVFRVAGAVAFMAYGLGEISDSIWKGQPWSNTVRALFDALVYGLVTGGAFGWLWPR
jgi:hypothetical protein